MFSSLLDPDVREAQTLLGHGYLFDLVMGLRRPGGPPPDPAVLSAMGFTLLGTLERNEEDGLADFEALREPTPFEGPR